MNRRDVLRGVLPATVVAPVALARAGLGRSEVAQRPPNAIDDVALVSSTRSQDHAIFVGDYGAVGDGVNDDTATVQAALSDAASRGLPLVLGHGEYRVEGLTAADFDQVRIWGQGPSSTTLKLRDDDGLGGLGQILLLRDVVSFELCDLTIHGNFANAKAGDFGAPLVRFLTTEVTRGREDFCAHIENVDLIESAKGFGQIYVSVEQIASAPYSRWSRVTVRNVRSLAHGSFGPAVQIHGPGDFVQVEAMTTRNDGPFGLECVGPVTYPGSNAKPLAISCDKDIDHYIRHATVTGLTAYRDNGGLFVQRIKRLDASNIVVDEDCTNPFYDQAPRPFTANPTTDVVTTAFPEGRYGDSTVVRLSTTGTLPRPLVAGQMYFVRDRRGDQFRLANSSGGAALNLLDVGTGTHSVEFLGYTYTSAIKGDDNVHTPQDPVVHRFVNVSVVRSSPHTGNRNFSWEESIVGTAGRLVLEDCSFNRAVSVKSHFPGQSPTIRRCTFETGWLSNISFGTASPIALGDGVIEDCTLNGLITLTQSADLTIRNCRFAVSLRHFVAPGASAILRLHDNVWNTSDKAAAILQLSPPAAGAKLLIEMRGNRVPPGAAFTTTAKMSSTDRTGLTLAVSDNDLVMGF